MSFLEYLERNYDNLIELSIEHVQLVVISMALAIVIGLPLGVVAHRKRLLRTPILSATSFFLTLPSLALFALFIPLFGLGAPPAIAGLTLYALLPVVSNTVAGLASVDPAVVKASRGMGIGSGRRLLQIELPLAWPVIVTGIRVSTQVIVGIAAIAVFVGGPGLGNEIFRGLRSVPNDNAPNLIYGGTLAIIVLALLFDAVFVLIRRLTTSRGIR
ncbi:ABC transporter permease [Aeromicrobium sp. CF4.19]|uniref:ABC transporter permease n=1 Tax=Aeromicrobium sp. CF4.19 TaxID=3373082 RepID=UPI003EE7EF8E